MVFTGPSRLSLASIVLKLIIHNILIINSRTIKIKKQANNAYDESISTDAKVYVCSEQHLISLHCCFGTKPRNQTEIENSEKTTLASRLSCSCIKSSELLNHVEDASTFGFFTLEMKEPRKYLIQY